ncbi:hypothetical protein BURCE16_32520 [Burkholderia cepacia]|nr:hypothetical protein BURCE16_32520 [Burkholderia cepacia]
MHPISLEIRAVSRAESAIEYRCSYRIFRYGAMQTFPFNQHLSTDECTTLVRQCRADAIFDISMSQEKGKVRGVASGWVSTVTVAHAAQSDTHSTVSARGSASARSMPDSRKSVMRRTIPPPCRSMLVGKRDSGHGPRLTTGGRKARVWRPEPNPQAATCARPRWFEAECGKARAERLKVRLDQGPGRDAGGRDQTRQPWAGGYDYLRGRSPNTARPTAPVPIARPFPVPVYSTLSDTSVIRIMCGFTPSSSSAGTASFG